MKVLDADKLTDLAAAWATQGYRVVAPVRQGDVVRLDDLRPGCVVDLATIPVNSVKDFLFPKSEVIGRSRLDGSEFAALDAQPDAQRTVIVGVRPCDAASLDVLDAVFNWDYKDAFYNARRQACTIVVLACTAADEQCFCTSVSGAPGATRGADATLRPAERGTKLILEGLTEKGLALTNAGGVLADGQARADALTDVPAREFDPATVARWLADNFESPLWKQLSLACMGCAACAFACPSCHCFDIQDEASRHQSVRLRNWDACGLGLFTLHASGHNPRPDQSARWRQRVMHKFSYIPQRFSLLGCTGCGRCGRLCPNGMAIAEVCEIIQRVSQASAKTE